jgi:RND family efflux transporter MFP subunit
VKNLRSVRVLVTVSVVAVAVAAAWLLWRTYLESPWTRDGRVRADIVQVAPDVAGAVVEVRVKDNQEVRKGEVLLVVDPERYRLALARAEASLKGREAEMEERRGEEQRRTRLPSGVVSEEARGQAEAAFRAAQAAYAQADAELEAARLNLARTEVHAPVNGYVTNLQVEPGDYAVAGRPLLALVDGDSFHLTGYFEETKLARIREGDPVSIRLMGFSAPLAGHVESIARAVTDLQATSGSDLVASVSPTFAWVRLAQRIPVRIALDRVPPGVRLVSGMTATLAVTPEARRP